MKNYIVLTLGIAFGIWVFPALAADETLVPTVPAAPVAATAPDHPTDEVRPSVVKILATQRQPDPFKPWTKQAPSEISGSGVVIAGHHILTNAHVVGYATEIYVQPYQSADKLSAHVVAIAPGVDLAELDLDDAKFFDTHPALQLNAELPHLKDKVNVYGYPTGGAELSVTEGIISRIEYAPIFFGDAGVRIQIDAALNPGNSGGPVISDGKIIGIAFSGIPSAEKIGYLIAAEEVQEFLVVIAKGPYPGKLAVHVAVVQPTQNPALRKFLKLDDATTGPMVTCVVSQAADFPLHSNDIITHIGQYAVDNEANIRVRDDLRLNLGYYVSKLADHGKIDATIFRDGKSMKVQVPLCYEPDMLIRITRYTYPRYLIYGPLVFTPVTANFLQAIPPNYQAYFAKLGSPMISRAGDAPAFPGEELVAVASPLFPHRITKGYNQIALSVVSSVNGVPVKSLDHLATLLRDLKDDTVIFRFADRRETLFFNRKEIQAATEEILSDNGIRSQYSDDLRDVWEKKSN